MQPDDRDQSSSPLTEPDSAPGGEHSQPPGTSTDDTSSDSRWSAPYPGGSGYDPQQSPVSLAAPGLATQPRLVPAILAGIVAAVVAAVVWYLFVAYSNWQIGFLAIAVGLLIGFAMKVAAGRVGGPRLQVAALLLTAISMFFAEFLIARHQAGEYFVSQGNDEPLALLIPPADMFAVVADVVAADPITLAFWAIALYGAFKMTRRTDEAGAVGEQPSAAPTA